MNGLMSLAAKRSLIRSIGLSAVIICLASMVATAQSPPRLSETAIAIEASGKRFEFQVELAVTPAERARGLMFRASLAEDHGMLFDFGHPQPVAMWMRNTYIPLDILFIRGDGSISRIARDAQPLSDTIIDSTEPVRAVLELRGGRTAKLGIKPGDRVLHPLFEQP